VLHEGEWNKYDDLLLLLQAKKDWLPVNISLVPGRVRYSDPLRWWAEVWLRAYQEAELRKTGNAPKLKDLVPLVGGIAGEKTVRKWNSGFPQKVEDLPVDDAPSDSAVPGPSGESGVGASPTPLPSGLAMSGSGSGSGVGASGFAAGGVPVPVVSGAGGWQVGSELQYSGGGFGGGDAVPAPLGASDGVLGLVGPRHLAPGGTGLVSSGAGAEGQGATGAGSGDALRAGVPAGLPWGAGPGEDGSLKAYLKVPGRSGKAPQEVLGKWVGDLQDAAVTVTGMRVPAFLVAVLSDGQVEASQVYSLTEMNAEHEPRPGRVRDLMPEWVKAFRPGELQWYEGEHGGKLEKYDDLLLLLRAKKDQLPVNISFERTGKGYSDPLRRWAEVWIREYWEAKFDATTGKSVSSASLAKRSGRIVSSSTV
ncbi:hypothetical protein ACFOSH_45090, partial [Amycolatopsis speibonae]